MRVFSISRFQGARFNSTSHPSTSRHTAGSRSKSPTVGVPYTFEGMNQNDFDMADMRNPAVQRPEHDARYAARGDVRQSRLRLSADAGQPVRIGHLPVFSRRPRRERRITRRRIGRSREHFPVRSELRRYARIRQPQTLAIALPAWHSIRTRYAATLVLLALPGDADRLSNYPTTTPKSGNGTLSTGTSLTSATLSVGNQVVVGDQITNIAGQPPRPSRPSTWGARK